MSENKKRTLREIKSIVEYLRDQKGAITIKIDGIEVSFLPKEINQARDIIETISTVVNASEADIEVKKEVEANSIKTDPDLFASAE